MARFLKKIGKQLKETVNDVEELVHDVVGDIQHSLGHGGDDNTKGGHCCQGSTLLHGELDIEVKAARGLPDTDNIFFNIGKLIDKKNVTDPFVTAFLGTNRILMTSVRDNTMDPSWNERFVVPVCHMVDSLVMEVRDKDQGWAEAIGKVVIDVEEILEGEVGGWYDIISSEGGTQGELLFNITFCPNSSLDKQYSLDSYFPMRSDCHVELFSCARNSPHPVELSDGSDYLPGSCYINMFRTIMAARKFLYITGWSVWTDLQLVRGDDVDCLEDEEEINCAHLTLGELLKMKAGEGVKVLIMIWSEVTSSNMREKGMMGTHDMETFHCFQGSDVECCLVPRQVGVADLTDVGSTMFAGASYSHHQKTIIADSEPVEGDDRRTITAYVGGLDITDGRYDTPDHPLFKTLLGNHSADFYQNSAPGIKVQHGPRQPWQDIHSRVTGRVAQDILENFIERWTKQARGRLGMLYPLRPEEFNMEAKTGNWNVQLLRSITNDSAAFSDAMRFYTLTVKKSRKIEASIAQAYIKFIRSAQRYIYIENQYFLGSAFAWMKDNKISCHHTIPIEIAEKVAGKIEAGEDFSAYIVVPLHPEGDPSTAPLQEILAWQRRTMAMMYKRVVQALEAVGSSAHPTDYLIFFCLVNREREEDIPEGLLCPPAESTAERLRQSRRFMIYVHSKLMIVDDSIAIVGSANINQRSLSGSRDTEIAVSCHQPEHVVQDGDLPQGEVARFRLRLMEEHLGVEDSALLQPHTMECTQLIKDVCANNWEEYFSLDSTGGGGHLIQYPVDISQNGDMSAKSDCPTFPDTSAIIEGTTSVMIPEKLTT